MHLNRRGLITHIYVPANMVIICFRQWLVTGEFPSQRTSYTENVAIWWHHHDDRKRATLTQCRLPRSLTAISHCNYYHFGTFLSSFEWTFLRKYPLVVVSSGPAEWSPSDQSRMVAMVTKRTYESRNTTHAGSMPQYMVANKKVLTFN